MSVHEGHRQRKKEQFREHGLDAFADHEALELLLYYAIPRQDTNPIAHRLIERFGSLEGVFSAPAYELQKVEGVGENAATLIRLLFPLCRRVRTSGGRHEVIFNTRENIGAYFIELFFGERREVFARLLPIGGGQPGSGDDQYAPGGGKRAQRQREPGGAVAQPSERRGAAEQGGQPDDPADQAGACGHRCAAGGPCDRRGRGLCVPAR